MEENTNLHSANLADTENIKFEDLDGDGSPPLQPSSQIEYDQNDSRFSTLTFEQVKRIDNLVNEVLTLEGNNVVLPIKTTLYELITAVKNKLAKNSLKIRDIRLIGGAASHVLIPETESYSYFSEEYTSPTSQLPAEIHEFRGVIKRNMSCPPNDIHIVFGMEVACSDCISSAVYDVILDLLPASLRFNHLHHPKSLIALAEKYICKQFKPITVRIQHENPLAPDRWSSIALGYSNSNTYASTNPRRHRVEFKFVHTWKRQYEFSMDSFQIILDSMMLFHKIARFPVSATIFPTVIGESFYGDFHEALFHLNNKIILSKHPEEIHGGGLLTYCTLIAKGYRPIDSTLQRDLWSQFYLDFPGYEAQRYQLKIYLEHYLSGVHRRFHYTFLVILHNVVSTSAECLKDPKKIAALQLIQQIVKGLYT